MRFLDRADRTVVNRGGVTGHKTSGHPIGICNTLSAAVTAPLGISVKVASRPMKEAYENREESGSHVHFDDHNGHAGLMRAGAGVGTLVAFLTGWAPLAVARLPMEFGILGWKLTLIRFASTFFFPPIAGLIAHTLFKGVK